jgi:hypothetical protein
MRNFRKDKPSPWVPGPRGYRGRRPVLHNTMVPEGSTETSWLADRETEPSPRPHSLYINATPGAVSMEWLASTPPYSLDLPPTTDQWRGTLKKRRPPWCRGEDRGALVGAQTETCFFWTGVNMWCIARTNGLLTLGMTWRNLEVRVEVIKTKKSHSRLTYWTIFVIVSIANSQNSHFLTLLQSFKILVKSIACQT